MSDTAAALPAPQHRPDRLERIVHEGGLAGFKAVSEAAACLVPLLNAVRWRGTPRHLAEALPHFAEGLDIDGVVRVLANLGYRCRPVHTRLRRLDPRLFPCLFAPDDGPVMLVYERDGSSFTVFDGASGDIVDIDGRMAGTAYIVRRADLAADQARRSAGSWFLATARRFRKQLLQLFVITFFINLLALAMPLFIMAVYDRVIGSQSLRTLGYLLIGVAVAILGDLALRVLRARLLGYIGARIDVVLGGAAFQQVINLPLVMTERATIGAQVSRLKQFETIRDFFTGSLAGVFLDLPYVLLFVAVIALIGGPIAYIPLGLLAVFIGFGTVVVPATRKATAALTEARAQRQSFVIEMLASLRAIKTCAAEASWSQRFRDLSARCTMTGFRATQIAVLIQTVAQVLMLAAGIATIGFGALRVLDGEMTIGALVACMILAWRVLVPLQVGFLSLSKFQQIKLSLQHLDRLMRLEPEREAGELGDENRTLKGEIAFRRVSLRYSPNCEPALLGAEFRTRPGELVAITGRNGAGKSSILKLTAGLYQAQAGAVLIDGMDIRQLDPGELRTATACVPQFCDLFHGTIAQNLRLANPTASDQDLMRAATDAAVLDEILKLPEGFETRLTDRLQKQLPNGFKQGIMLARAYVKHAPIYLLDEPASYLDEEGDRALMRKLEDLRGRATVLIVTHRPSHLRLADRVLYMDAGRILFNGPPDEVLPKL